MKVHLRNAVPQAPACSEVISKPVPYLQFTNQKINQRNP